jgi:hypothetical protein
MPFTALVGAFVMITAVPAAAQIRASERGTVSQTIDGTTVTVDYSRPSARGRVLFGGLVPFGGVWTPGANWATTLESNRDLRLNGVEVPSGKYSVWMIPREGDWTLTLNGNPELFHFQKPDSAEGRIHVAVRPEERPHTEMLTWSFPRVSGDAAVLELRWGTSAVSVRVVVQPTEPVALDPEERSSYVGSYDLSLVEGIGWPTEASFEVFEEAGVLRARLPFPIHHGDELTFDLIPAGVDRFSPGLYRNGTLFNVEPGITLEFERSGEQASAVRIRAAEGSVVGEGPRAGG